MKRCSFRLPANIVVDICEFLRDDKATLAALALVHRDWNRVVRAYQFFDVQLDFSERSVKFMEWLLDESDFILSDKD